MALVTLTERTTAHRIYRVVFWVLAFAILFYIPWASHDTNSVLDNQDGIGPLRRGQIMVSCTSLSVLSTVASPTQNPTLATLVQLLGVPDKNEVCGKGARK